MSYFYSLSFEMPLASPENSRAIEEATFDSFTPEDIDVRDGCAFLSFSEWAPASCCVELDEECKELYLKYGDRTKLAMGVSSGEFYDEEGSFTWYIGPEKLLFQKQAEDLQAEIDWRSRDLSELKEKLKSASEQIVTSNGDVCSEVTARWRG